MTTTLRSPADYVASIPKLVGFTPQESVVVTYLVSGKVVVTQRADIEALADPEAFYGPVRKHQFDEAIIVGWSKNGKAALSEDLEVFANYLMADLHVRDVLWTDGIVFSSVLCENQTCCPPEGRPIGKPFDADTNFTVAGSREDLASEACPSTLVPRKNMVVDPVDRPMWVDTITDYFLTGNENEDALRDIAWALHDIRVRDTVLFDSLSVEDTKSLYEYACKVARATHPADASPICTLVAIFAWMLGDGARALVALEYVDESYSLGTLVGASIAGGLPPQAWKESMLSLTREICLKGGS